MNTSKKTILSLAILASVSALAVYSFSPGQVLAQSVDPQALVSQPTQDQAQSQDQGQDQVMPPQVNPIQPPSPDAPVAIPATTPPITGPAVPSVSPGAVPPGEVSLQVSSDPEVARLQREAEAHAQRIAQMTSNSADESAILREVARYQARLSLLNVVSKVESTQQQMASSRAKFEVEQAKTLSELNSAQPSLPVPAPGQAPIQDGQTLGEAEATPEVPYTLVGLSSFGERNIAQLAGPVGTQSVEVGSIIGDGYRVSRVSSDSVVLTHKGKRHTLYLSPLPSGSASGANQGSLNNR